MIGIFVSSSLCALSGAFFGSQMAELSGQDDSIKMISAVAGAALALIALYCQERLIPSPEVESAIKEVSLDPAPSVKEIFEKPVEVNNSCSVPMNPIKENRLSRFELLTKTVGALFATKKYLPLVGGYEEGDRELLRILQRIKMDYDWYKLERSRNCSRIHKEPLDRYEEELTLRIAASEKMLLNSCYGQKERVFYSSPWSFKRLQLGKVYEAQLRLNGFQELDVTLPDGASFSGSSFCRAPYCFEHSLYNREPILSSWSEMSQSEPTRFSPIVKEFLDRRLYKIFFRFKK